MPTKPNNAVIKPKFARTTGAPARLQGRAGAPIG
jgi:hypothetical protein